MRSRWFLLLLCSLVVVAAAASRVRADGPALQTLELGSGPTVVMVPGLGIGRTDWLPTVRRLRERYHCVMVEIPGQGTSPLPDPFSLQAAANALADIIAQQKPESTIVVGSGVGGLLAVMAANAHPDHQRGVMLIDTQVRSPFQVPDQQRDALFKFMDENYSTFVQGAFSRMGRDSSESARIYTMMAAVPPVTMKAYLRHLVVLDANRDVKALRVPLSLVFSERNWKPGTSWGTVSRAYGFEDSTLAAPVRIAGAGMLVMKDQPDSLAAVVSGFSARTLAVRN